MLIRKVILFAVIFLLLGEALIRIDEMVAPFSNDDQVRIAIKMQESNELKLVESKTVPMDDSVYRVMVLGDSYIEGPGIPADSKFSAILRKNLLNETTARRYKKCLVLDVSRPSNNNLDNLHTYETFAEKFKPQMVILAYNLNDVTGNLDEGAEITGTKKGIMPGKQMDKKTFIHKIYDIVYQSHMLQYTLKSLNAYLKSVGYIVPKSVFSEILKEYTDNRESWVKSKAILDRLVTESEKSKHELIVTLMPEFDLIGTRKIFINTDRIIEEYFTKSGVTFINPAGYFTTYKPAELRQSKYDGHPSSKAHQILADSMMIFLREKYLKN